MYISLVLRNNRNHIYRIEKYINFVLIFLLGVIPMILDNSLYRNNLDTNYCIIWYIIGGIIWACKIPENYINLRYFNSVGWMHVCIIIGDIYLINSIGYIR